MLGIRKFHICYKAMGMEGVCCKGDRHLFTRRGEWEVFVVKECHIIDKWFKVFVVRVFTSVTRRGEWKVFGIKEFCICYKERRLEGVCHTGLSLLLPSRGQKEGMKIAFCLLIKYLAHTFLWKFAIMQIFIWPSLSDLRWHVLPSAHLTSITFKWKLCYKAWWWIVRAFHTCYERSHLSQGEWGEWGGGKISHNTPIPPISMRGWVPWIGPQHLAPCSEMFPWDNMTLRVLGLPLNP